jgi:hypothetical protein
MMASILRKQTDEDRVEGRKPLDWGENDYAVLGETLIGRIYKEEGLKWRWYLEIAPVPPPYEGVADTLDEARAAIAKRYREIKQGK